jgi:hypothetical protein
MRPLSFIAFAVISIALLAGAIYSVATERGTTTVATGGAPVFPDLKAHINDADEIEVANNAGHLTIKREGEDWKLVEKQGYPVPFDKAKDLLIALADLKLLEPKTKDPERYERLAVQDIGPKASDAVRITVKDRAGKTLAAAIFGKRNESLYGKMGGGIYLRRVGEDQAWLAEGTVKVGVTHKEWVDRLIVDLKKKDVKRVAMHHPGEGSFTASKTDANQKNLKLDKMPEGRKLKSDGEIDGIVEIMDKLDLEDVKKATDVEFPVPGHSVEFSTFDGMIVRVEATSPKQYVYWAKFSARIAPDAAEPDKVRAEVEKINARVNGWAYEIAAGYGEKIMKKLEELLDEKKPAS